VADVADYEAVERFASGAVEKLGSPRFLVNNAAVINANAPLWEVGVEEFARLMQINVNGTFHVIRAFLPGMAEAGVGTIINFSSGWGRSTSPEVAPYCASKFAIEGLTQALAQELPPGLVTVALNPGVIHTQMLESCFGAAASHSHTPEVWARMAVPFLLGLREADNGRSLTVLG
jgi:NAD(P)-dependent dehydrogenase (short-subunit alcohol dehydrogenase family)